MMRSVAAHRRTLLSVLLAAVVVPLVAGCSHTATAKPTTGSSAVVARPLNSDEADLLAVTRFNAYRAKVLSVTGTIVGGSAAADVALRGWIDTVNGQGYGLIRPSQGGGFLTVWNSTQISAQDYTGSAPPLPRPQAGWSSTTLKAGDSALAAAQLVLLGLSSDRPDNPQLLIQNGAKWQGTGTVDGVKVIITSGPLAAGATVSNLRYWIDSSGRLRRLQARLDGRDWSTFDLTLGSGVKF